jgi:predicted Zn-dependent protease
VELAGYDLSAAAIFMDKLSVFNRNSDQEAGFFSSHPSSPEREARLIKIEEEILTKQRTGADLLPNRL